MPNTPNASFIPKQGSAKRVRQTASRQVHILTVVSYVLFVATLVASMGVFFYNRYLDKRLNGEVEKLSSDIGGFSEADMDTVREFNIRLHQAQGRIDKSISITSVFGALEDATLKSVAISELTITREDDSQILVKAKVNTDSFDASLFQRGVYERNSVIKNVEITDLTLDRNTEENSISGVSFLAKITVPLQDIPYKPGDITTPEVDTTEASSTLEADTASSSEASSTATTN